MEPSREGLWEPSVTSAAVGDAAEGQEGRSMDEAGAWTLVLIDVVVMVGRAMPLNTSSPWDWGDVKRSSADLRPDALNGVSWVQYSIKTEDIKLLFEY